MAIQEEKVDFTTVEITVEIPRGVYDALMREIGYCGCTLNGIASAAILTETVRRARERKQQAEFDDGTLKTLEEYTK
jgi:hypothetical protein